MNSNILLQTDSYKLTHWKQYPPKTEKVYSYFESRGGEYDEVVFFGLQYYLKKYLTGVRVTKFAIDQAEALCDAHIGPGHFNREGWEHIRLVHGGRLPIRIKAVPEGTVVPVSNVLMTIENLDPKCYWLTNYLETLLVQVWYGCTVATQSRAIRKDILAFLEETGDPAGIDFKLHDFGFRGVSSVESAGVGAAAHLLNFLGTDTLAGIMFAKEYYNAQGMTGFSIPASEHSTITSWGRKNEADAMRNMLEQYPTGLVACVSDSYDIFNACANIWGDQLKDQVLARDGVLVVRPDSGDPVSVVLDVLGSLGNKFGFTKNAKGYNVLNPKVRVIQGDGVGHTSIFAILDRMKEMTWSADNIAFGMGGNLLQNLNRDTQKFAFKCSAVTIDGVEYPVSKNPVTDIGKRSKEGRLMLVQDKTLVTKPYSPEYKDELVTVFDNGEIVCDYSFEECRERAKA